jgi:hypothetical protein
MEHYYCEGCGLYFGDENGLYGGYEDPAMYMTPAHGHDTQGVEAVKENETDPTCTEAGGYDMVIYCNICGFAVSTEHTVIPALGHSPAEPLRENELPASCTSAGSYEETVYCEICGEELSRSLETVPAPGHSLTHVAAVQPDCDDYGSAAHYACESCGRVFSDSQGSSEIYDPHDLLIEPLGHSWSEWEESGAYNIRSCLVCGVTDTVPNGTAGITVQPVDFSGKIGDAVSFSLEAIGDGLTYQWQYSSDGGKTWKNSGLPGNNTDTLTTTLTEARLIYRFRCVVTDSGGNKVYSDIVRMLKTPEE